jgi:hypothetical protein
MLIAINPDSDPLESVLKRPIRSSQESMTPTLESRKDFIVVVHHHTQVDGTGILRNEATAIEFSSSMSPKVNRNPEFDPPENMINRPIRSWESTTPALERRKYFPVVVHHRTEVDTICVFRNEASVIEFSGVNGSKSLQHWVRVIPV